MQCSPTKALTRAIRFMLFPRSKVIEEKNIELGDRLDRLKNLREQTTREVSKIDQPDILRSLVISMSNPQVGGKR